MKKNVKKIMKIIRCIKPWGYVLLCPLCLYLFFWLFPKLLPWLISFVYPSIDLSQEENSLLKNLGAWGDSYGIYNALFSALAFIVVAYTLYLQQRNERKTTIANRFYAMLDHKEKLIEDMSVYPIFIGKRNVPKVAITGRSVFVEYKIQLKYLVRVVTEVSKQQNLDLTDPDIADIAYAVFYYGVTQKEFMKEYLRDYDKVEILVDGIVATLETAKYKKYALHRPNQNYLSVYFRNVYNMVKMIDSSALLSDVEKREYIKVLRAQFSNAELYVLFFNLISRFGKKWLDNKYISKYELIQNLPIGYCDGYNPKEYFEGIHFESEESTLSTFHEVVRTR